MREFAICWASACLGATIGFIIAALCCAVGKAEPQQKS